MTAAREDSTGATSERRTATRVRLLALVFVLAALLGVAGVVLRYRLPCSSAKLRRNIEALERVDDRAAILTLEDELHETLTEACSDAPLVGLPSGIWFELRRVTSNVPSFAYRPGHALCFEFSSGWSVPTLEDWNVNLRMYEQCGFARFGLYDLGEASNTWIPPLSFWVAYAQVLESGVDDELARRYFRLLAKVLDRQMRAPDVVIVEPGLLRIRSWHDGPPSSDVELEILDSGNLDLSGLGPTDNYDLLRSEHHTSPALPGPGYAYKELVRISLDPDTPAEDLRWIVDARNRNPQHDGEFFWLLLADFDATREPTVTAIRYADRHQYISRSRDWGDASLFITTTGWTFGPRAETHDVPRAWADLESAVSQIMREADGEFELVVELDANLDARRFLDVIRTVDHAMGPQRHPWLRLPNFPLP